MKNKEDDLEYDVEDLDLDIEEDEDEEDEDDVLDATLYEEYFDPEVEGQELVKMAAGGINELTKAQRKLIMKRRMKFKRENPGLSRKLARSARRNSKKLSRGRKKFMRTAAGRRSILRRGKRKAGVV